MAIIDESGKKYGKLTVIERDIERSKKNAYWICKCECGNTTSVLGTKLRSGETKSCGCLRKAPSKNAIDISGQTFSHLTVIERAGSTPGGIALWFCRCDCGNPNLVKVQGSHLRNGHTTSCGCVQKEAARKSALKDITN